MGIGISGALQAIGGAGSDEELFGKRVVVPDYPNASNTLRKAIETNTQLLPDITTLGAGVNQFNQAQLEAMLRRSIPDLDIINQQASDNIIDMMRGKVPDDVARYRRQLAAEKAVGGGFSGSGVHRNLEDRDLALTSLDLTQKGLTSAEQWIASARANQMAPMYDVTRMFMTPEAAFDQADKKFQRDLYAAQIEAAPDPAKRGAWDSEMSMLGMILSIYGGGAGYTGGYKGTPTPGGGGGGTPGGGGSSYVPYTPSYTNESGGPTATEQGSAGWSFGLF